MPRPLRCHHAAQADHAQLYEILVDQLIDFVIFLIDPDGCIVSWNPGVERVLGYTESEWVGLPVAQIFTPEDRAQEFPQRELTRSRQTGRASDVRWHMRKDGERLYVEGTMVALRDDAGQLLGYSKVMRDITERYRREQQSAFLLRLDDVLRPLNDPTEMMHAAAELLGEHLQVDRCTYCHVGADEETLDILDDYTRLDVSSLRDRYRLSDFGDSVAESLRSNCPVIAGDVEAEANLSEVWAAYRQAEVRAHASVPLRKAGKLVAVMAVHQRTTRAWQQFEVELVQLVADRCWESVERARVTRALRESEERHCKLFQEIDEGYCIIEMCFDSHGTANDYRFVDVNPAFQQHTGLVGARDKTIRELVPNHDQHWFEIYGKVAATGESTRFIEHSESMARWFDVYAFRLGNPEDNQVAVLFRDITAKKAAEGERELLLQEITRARLRLDQAFSQAPVAVVVFRGKEFIVELANPSYQALLAGRQLVGRPFAEVMPELGTEVWDVLFQVFESGEPFVTNDWLIPYDLDQDGIPEDHWFNVAYNPLREADGSISGLVAVSTEVTNQVLARQELERTNAELGRANRSLEEFAYVASHDMQEPLRMVNAYSELLLRSLGKSTQEELNTYAGFVEHGVRRMQELIRDLLTFARTIHANEPSEEAADLSRAFSEALSRLAVQVKESDAIITAPPLPTVRGDTKQMAHVFQNLLANSLKYHSKNKIPEISLTCAKEEEQWIISVRDNGIGFEPQYAQQIFGLFKRLHRDEYPGTGLGLAICQRVVERYGGRMWAQSQLGQGATFSFSLPALQR